MDNQRRFMYLFERIGEPLYFGPRGTSNVVYNVPVDTLSERRRKAMTTVRAGFTNLNLTPITIPGIQAPNLSNIGRMCPRNSLFSYFVPSHKTAADDLTSIFMNQSNADNFLAMASVCRDSENVNCSLWVHSFASACLQRKDMRGFRMPALFEIMPDAFLNPHVIRQAQEQAGIPTADRSGIRVDMVTTSQDNNPENVLAYFREDLGINSHHWHWHLIYTPQAPVAPAPGSRDRKGELFYYMHHNMLARYEAERLSNGMGRVQPLVIDRPVSEGYFPKLTQANSGTIWGSRQEGTMLTTVDRVVGQDTLTVSLEDLRNWNDRIFAAIDSGVILNTAGARVTLTEERGIDILGDIVENGGTVAPNSRFYGNLHNMGHVMLAFSHDPRNRHNENNGVMGDTVGAMRDPVFYRWHKYIDDVFDRYKRTLTPYPQDKLIWPGIQVTSLSVQTGKQPVNNLITHWTQRDLDLARGLDFSRNSREMGAIWARLTTLDHMPFTFRIDVTNTGRQAVNGTVRIFMAPRNDERNVRLNFREQRLLFFELDKFVTQLQPGQNTITRNSTDSSVTIPWPQSFQDLENLPQNAMDVRGDQAVCGCGWPNHMLIPRGSAGQGTIFDLFVIITNETEDRVPRSSRQSASQQQGCKESVSYCGLLDELYPDKRPMGFPFDRQVFTPNTRTPIRDLDAFIPANSNMRYQMVRISHRADITNVIGRAPSRMTFIDSNGANVPGTGSGSGSSGSTTNNNNNNNNNTTTNNNNSVGSTPQQQPNTGGGNRIPNRGGGTRGPNRGGGGGGNISFQQNGRNNFGGSQTPPRTPSPVSRPVVPVTVQQRPPSQSPPPNRQWGSRAPQRQWGGWGRDSRSPSPDNFELLE